MIASERIKPPFLEVRRVSKRFPGVRALRDVSLTLNRAEVLAVIGENGAGKSTLMKILAGIQPPDSGEILIDGAPVQIDSIPTAQTLGIALIHQELNLSDNLDIGANLFLGREPRQFGLIDEKRIADETYPLLKRIGLDQPPTQIVGNLSIGRQQLVEIAKAVSANARILIMDEPTSSLSQHETENLYRVIRELRSSGVSIVYISHRLGEVIELADRVVVLRDGLNAGELSREQIDRKTMVKMMVGRELSQFYTRKSHERGAVALEAKEVTTSLYPQRKNSFAISAGEIVGLAGLVGAGRTELLRGLFGVDPLLSGSLEIAGTPLRINSPLEAIRAGLALVPEDRKEQGLILGMGIRENVSLASLRRDQTRGFLNFARENELTAEAIRFLNIKTSGPNHIVQLLSGGNQQKVVLAKWLALKPKVLLLDEPTRGIDVGAKQEIYRLMEKLAAEKVAILFVSSEMEEILGMSDRALVMHEGRITGELKREQLSEEAVMHFATGGE